MAASARLALLALALLSCCHLCPSFSLSSIYNRSITMPSHPLTFNPATIADGTPCHHQHAPHKAQPPQEDNSSNRLPASSLKLQIKHRRRDQTREDSLKESATRDLSRIQTLSKRATDGKKEINPSLPTEQPELAGRMVVTVESGVNLGSGEYIVDAYVGTPPVHFPMILDTGSDLIWIQCLPCYHCFPQHGPVYDPSGSSSYRNVTCGDPRCSLVSSPTPPRPCSAAEQPCPYYYWYGDRSNTTGDLALESFTVNLTSPAGGEPVSRQVEGLIFGCGHWNRGLFHGAAGLLGLGRGPLSFSSQLRSLYGHTFSYCLVDWNSDLTVSSKLIFGEDETLMRHPDLNYTSFIAGKENPVDTFYYVQIKGVTVGGELLDIPPETWELSKDGVGGTIIDSGTTLSYFVDPAYHVIREAFIRKVKMYPSANFPFLNPCYNVSGIPSVELPEFTILFADGAVWNFPVANYFIRLEEGIMCLAILGSPRSYFSIIGNYQQQNFHILYDNKKSRLGFAPTKCAEV